MQESNQGTMQHHHDVIIVGGGMVGAALAARLGNAGKSVGLVEQGDAPAKPEGDYDLRISSLNARSLAFINASGTQLPEERSCPFRHIDVANQDGTGHSLFSAADSGMDDFGIFVENRTLQYALWQRLAELPGVTCYTQCAPLSTLATGNARMLELDNGQTLTAALIVGADGASSTLRELASIGVTHYDYHQRAMIINVETELPQQDVSWQVFTPTGPLAMLPLPGQRASLVWYDNDEATKARELLDDEALKTAIEDAFPERLGKLTRVVARASFPIKRQHAKRYIGKRLALIGDAAHVVHPLAGQGLNIGLHDADTLAEIIIQGRDPGDYLNLLRFECQRRAANQAMIAATDSFHHLFTGAKPLRQLGDLSLHIAERIPFAKRMMMQQANGLNPFKRR
ncbi:2-octaprenyl-6-methoxyphenol hydroxylase /2-octaprenyl-3-methyl-6-methoxy-1,4-benzoquinol hydroxylase [Halomonas sp. HL-93]|nr:MAG: 2-octaprenyl-3-methyl-6-methoxy-1,4-benzoquinol hydroxylase UbiF [Halomonas sp. HL-93]SBR51042.1 2-octaprenyl-6-methoxyphenol hydroxylase /2-octaprenyl-3-methyl-6-methoxy-1,4-benzoquinol hydroxylase [Halomonas sp. HL-93]SNY97165.1 2-octaprenyl-6-methoxyphenol hydroxylase /2-octaprenyl-3-methyl-6-methoxy-1,4-benzoquinol hydroxylase [Halomonas sp. hl-4]